MPLLGGVQPTGQVSPQAQGFAISHLQEINGFFGVHNNSYQVVAESTQLVSGNNHFLHLIGHPDNQHYTVTVYAPFQGEAHIIEFGRGHLQHGHGYGEITHHHHSHHHHNHQH